MLPCFQNFTRFSSWFGNYSHGNKQRRLLAELSCAMAAGDTGATCSRNSVRLDYLPALRQVSTVNVWLRLYTACRGLAIMLVLLVLRRDLCVRLWLTWCCCCCGQVLTRPLREGGEAAIPAVITTMQVRVAVLWCGGFEDPRN